MVKHVTIRVSGKVQGVFFRASTREQAAEHGIQGYVRNEPDGSVLIEAEGEEENLSLFLAWCRQGPKHANVEHCDVESGEVKGFQRFVIER